MVTLRLLGGASLDSPDGPVTGRAALRHRLALLALLAVEHPRPLSRDKVVAYLWPESAAEDARHLLRSSLYILRSALGEDAVLGTGDDLRLNPARLTCDLWEFEAALARNDLEQAVAICRGPFLPRSTGNVAWRSCSSKSGAARHGTTSAPSAEKRAACADPVYTRTT